MKRLHTTALLVAVLGFGFLVVAGTAKAEDPKLSYKMGRGFSIESPDDNFKITIGGYVQPRFTYLKREKNSYTDGFNIQRGKITLDGNVLSKNLKYGFAMNLATRSAATKTTVCKTAACTGSSGTTSVVSGESTAGLATLDDYFVDWVPSDAIGIKVGQFKVPFEMQELTSDTKLQFVDRSLSNNFFDFVRDIGMNLHGRLLDNKFGYNLFIFNGQGQNNTNSLQGMMTGARVDYSLLGTYDPTEGDIDMSQKPNLGTGIAYIYATEMDGAGAISENGTLTATSSSSGGTQASNGTWDAGFKYKGLSLQTALMLTRTYEKAALTNWGYNGQIGYMIIPRHFEFALKTGGAVFSNAVRNEYEYAADLNYFFKGHAVKLQADYTYLVNNRASTLNDQQFRTQLQLMF